MRTKIIFLTLISLLIINNLKAQNNSLAGDWQATNGTIMSFRGTQVSVGGDTYTYEVEDPYLSMYNQQGNVLEYTYQIKGNQLYLYLEGVGTYVLTRVGKTTSSKSYGNRQGSKNQLLGNWTANNGNVMNFRKNAVSVGGDTYTYQISGNQLTMYNNAGESLTYTYSIQGNQLYLYLEGSGTFVLTRGGNVSATNQFYNQNRGQINNSVNSAGAERIYGTFCSYSSSGYSGSSSYSTTTRVYFDGRGHYTYGSESSYSGNGDGYNGGSGGTGGTYRVVGNEGVILTANDGSVYKVAIYFVQDSGEITELKYDGVVYAKSLCD